MLTTAVVFVVSYEVFFSHGSIKSAMLRPALARASAKSARRSQLRFSHSEQVPLRRPVGSDIVRFGRFWGCLRPGVGTASVYARAYGPAAALKAASAASTGHCGSVRTLPLPVASGGWNTGSCTAHNKAQQLVALAEIPLACREL